MLKKEKKQRKKMRKQRKQNGKPKQMCKKLQSIRHNKCCCYSKNPKTLSLAAYIKNVDHHATPGDY